LDGLFVFRLFYMAVAYVTDGAGEKTAGAAGWVEQDFAWFGIDTIHHEGSDGAWHAPSEDWNYTREKSGYAEDGKGDLL
jgi:hypothetical protein